MDVVRRDWSTNYGHWRDGAASRKWNYGCDNVWRWMMLCCDWSMSLLMMNHRLHVIHWCSRHGCILRLRNVVCYNRRYYRLLNWLTMTVAVVWRFVVTFLFLQQ